MFIETDCSYELCLWDFSTLWYEKVEHDSFRVRAKVYKHVKHTGIVICYLLFHLCLSRDVIRLRMLGLALINQDPKLGKLF